MSFLKYVAIASVAIAGLSLLYNSAFAMYEDQVMICNFEDNCQIVNIDDYMSRQASDKLFHNFNNNLDTFDLKDAVN